MSLEVLEQGHVELGQDLLHSAASVNDNVPSLQNNSAYHPPRPFPASPVHSLFVRQRNMFRSSILQVHDRQSRQKHSDPIVAFVSFLGLSHLQCLVTTSAP